MNVCPYVRLDRVIKWEINFPRSKIVKLENCNKIH